MDGSFCFPYNFFFHGALRPQKPYGLLLRHKGRMGQGMRAQAHLPVHTASELCSLQRFKFPVALRPRRPYGLLRHRGRMGIRNESPRPPPYFTQLLSYVPYNGSSSLSPCVHGDRADYKGRRAQDGHLDFFTQLLRSPYNGQIKLQALVYDILPSRRKMPESDARSVRTNLCLCTSPPY